MQKTPEEIKKGLSVCATLDGDCENCPYDDGRQITCVDRSRRDSLAYIQKLESRLAKVERERDAAVHDLEEASFCADCKHYDESVFNEPCSSCIEDTETKKNWQWRGVCPENSKEESNDNL